MNLLEADSIVVSFDGRSILHNIYVKCEQNEIVGLLGRNGCGKSTLLNVIFGSLEPEHKSVRINGQWISHGYKNSKVSFLTQFGMIPSNIRLRQAIDLYEIDISVFRTYAPQLIPLLNSKPSDVSGGELRLTELLLVLFSRSQFCLLDEPFSGLSPVVIEQLIDIMKDVKKTKGILITDHLHRYVTSCSDRMYVMVNGRIAAVKGEEDLVTLGYLND